MPLTLPQSTSGLNTSDLGYDIWLLSGQSNMAGYAASSDSSLDVVDPRIWQYPTLAGNAYANSIVQASEPMIQQDGQKAGLIGPGLAFARAYLRTCPVNRMVLLVPAALGGTALVGGRWQPTTGDLYLQAIAQTNAAIAAAQAIYPNSRFIGTLWLQGEGDAQVNITQSVYATNFDLLIAGFRSSINGAANTPFILQQMVPDYIAANMSNYGPINLAHIDTPRRNVLTSFAYGPFGHNKGVTWGTIHYDAVGARIVGQNFFNAIASAQANVLGTPPLPPPALSIAQTSLTAVSIAWTRPTCRYTSFVVQYQLNGAGSWTTVSLGANVLDSSGKIDGISSGAGVTGLTNGSTYNFRIATVNEQGQSAYATYSLTMVPAPTLGSATSSTLAVNWTQPSSDYTTTISIKATNAGGSTYGQFVQIASGVTGSSYTITGLAAGTSYTVQAVQTNSAGAAITWTPVTASTTGSFVSNFGTAWSHINAANVTIGGGKVTAAPDQSGSGNNWLAPTTTTYQPTTGTVGGLTAVVLNPSTAIYTTLPSGSFTKLILINITAISTGMNIMSSWGGSSANGIGLVWTGTSGTTIKESSSTSLANEVTSGDNVPTGQWFVFAVTYNSASKATTMYYNGKLEASGVLTNAITILGTSICAIAQSATPSTATYQSGITSGGWVDAAIFTSVLSQLQIQQCAAELASQYSLTLS